MNKNILAICAFFGLFFFATGAYAQLDSQQSIGGRFGSSQGITYRYSLSQERAVEGILSVQSNSRYRRLRLVGLYEFHQPLQGNFSWYYGFGGSIGSFKEKPFSVMENNNSVRYDPKSEFSLSIDGIVGIEYAIPEAPISISLDVKPYLDFIQESTIKLFDPIGFSIRYKF